MSKRRFSKEHRERLSESIRASWDVAPSRLVKRASLAGTDDSILRALPGTLDQIADRTGLPRAVVAGRVRRMKEQGRIVKRTVHNSRGFGHAGEWSRVEGAKA